MFRGIVIISTLIVALPATSFAHRGSTHVQGVVQRVEGRNLTVKNENGRAIRIRLTPDTRYFSGRLKAAREDLHVGRHIAVEAFGMAGDYSATEIHLGPSPSTPEPRSDADTLAAPDISSAPPVLGPTSSLHK